MHLKGLAEVRAEALAFGNEEARLENVSEAAVFGADFLDVALEGVVLAQPGFTRHGQGDELAEIVPVVLVSNALGYGEGALPPALGELGRLHRGSLEREQRLALHATRAVGIVQVAPRTLPSMTFLGIGFALAAVILFVQFQVLDRLRDKHVNFLIVERGQYQPVLDIKLDGASHENDQHQ